MRTTNYETGFCVTEVRQQLSATVINEVLIKPLPSATLHHDRTNDEWKPRLTLSVFLLERTPVNVEAADVGRSVLPDA